MSKQKEPWAYVKCTRCPASIPIFGQEKTVKCEKCGQVIEPARPPWKPAIGKEEGNGYLWTQQGKEVQLPAHLPDVSKLEKASGFNSKLAVEAWRKRDAYLMDMVGFQQFLRYWMAMVDENGMVPNDEDFIPPCVQCTKRDVSCFGDHMHRVGGKKFRVKVVAPNSHVWTPLKRPRKGSTCENCRSTKQLMAYRAPYNSQTLCRSCLEKAKAGEEYTRSYLTCDLIVHRTLISE